MKLTREQIKNGKVKRYYAVGRLNQSNFKYDVISYYNRILDVLRFCKNYDKNSSLRIFVFNFNEKNNKYELSNIWDEKELIRL